MHLFSANVYKQRRSILAKSVGQGLIFLAGNQESPMNCAANVYPFRQDSSFLYYFGIDQPGLHGIIDIDSNESILFGDDASLDDIVWTGPQLSIRELADLVGVEQVSASKSVADYFELKKVKDKQLHFLPPYRADRTIQLSQWLQVAVAEIESLVSVDLIKAIVKQRSVKSAVEIAEMDKAVAITRAMHVAAMSAAEAGKQEAQLSGLIEGIALSMDTKLAYSAILSVDGQTLHNHHHHNIMQSGQIVLGDFGAQSKMSYAGDITRTFPVDQQFTNQQKEIYQIVLNAEMAAIDALQPGRTYQSIHLLASTVIAKGLTDMGLMKGDPAEAAKAGAHALFFPHGLGHMIGLDVHDMEDLGESYVGYDEETKRSDQFGTAYLRLGRKLEEGFALTIEPGIYFIPELIDQWRSEGKFTEYIDYEKLDAWKAFGGVRIEDNYVITEAGSQLIGPPIPKTIEEVEAIKKE